MIAANPRAIATPPTSETSRVAQLILKIGEQAPQRTLDLLMDRMPERPLGGSTLKETAWTRWEREEALGQRYCQYNPRARWGILSLDLDIQSALISAVDADMDDTARLPWPNAETFRKNGHSQAHWLLAAPVGTSAAHRLQPQRYATQVRHRLRVAYQGDRAASGYVMRGLFHKDQRTSLYHAHLYTLGELAALLPPVYTARLVSGGTTGRNDVMFRSLDRLAARMAADGADPHAVDFRQVLEIEARRLLQELPQGDHPYTATERRRTINSVLKRTQAGTNVKYARTYGGIIVPTAALRSRFWSTNRPAPLPEEEARENMAAASAPANAQRHQQASEMYREAARRLCERGEAVTETSMAAETGRTPRVVRRHAATWRAEAAKITVPDAQNKILRN